ncbi:MAG: 2-amino-4-hydroxy-6-hydroxymethyldihydropteridine diphosphokinase [Ghiorsea sp.]|nr:2-amino-4-hydroxy-6-hydroxymethyldihydropteridine diphosphokinase [Ghiorsea sp.]
MAKNKMTTVLLGLGSNINPEIHLMNAALALKAKFPTASFSSVYQSVAVGMKGDDFLNACCLLTHDMNAKGLVTWLKALEDQHDRDRSKGSWKSRTLDLDVLMVDGEVVDKDFYKYGHILIPAGELVQCVTSEPHMPALLTQVDITL